VASSPDNAGTVQYCQMVRVRLARRKGVREEPAFESSSRNPSARTWWIWAESRRAPAPDGVGNSWAGLFRRQGGYGEGLRRNRGDVAGAKLGAEPVERSDSERGNHPGGPFPASGLLAGG
jgi:hypothetical protein